MKRKRPITEDERQKIWAMHLGGSAVKEIRDAFGFANKSSVYSLLNRLRKENAEPRKEKKREAPAYLDIPLAPKSFAQSKKVAIIVTDSENVMHVLRDLWK